ncbi:MAG: hypothetical protein HN380_27440, partial [Victivallales bacterium]|nr:hypothetical protein [Victivallales bacterium]
LHAWEDERKGSPVGHTHYGGKSIALWPTGDDGCQDLFIFGHVHHHQLRFGAKPEVVRRDRVPTWDCAPAASAPVNGWSAPGKQNLVGVAPYATGVILFEYGGPGQPPKLVVQKPFTKPLVQPSANNQQPVFVECLRTSSPEGVIAVTPRGAQFFAKPDLAPGWVFAGMCPTSAAVAVPQAEGAPDLVWLGRENGRVLLLDAAAGTVRAQALLNGAVRKIAVIAGGSAVVGTNRGLYVLGPALAVQGSYPGAVEDLVVQERSDKTTAYVLNPSGQLRALRIEPGAKL